MGQCSVGVGQCSLGVGRLGEPRKPDTKVVGSFKRMGVCRWWVEGELAGGREV